MARRPVAGRPHRPFAGQPLASQPHEPAELAASALAPAQAVAAPAEPETAAVELSANQAAAPEREPWESMLDAVPRVSELAVDPTLAAARGAHDVQDAPVQSVTEEVAEIAAHDQQDFVVPEPAYDVERYGQPVATPDPEVTAEVPAFLDDLDEVAPIPVAESRTAFETPIFVTPASAPAVDTLIDEVDAAFITAGLPTSGGVASDQARQASAILERIALRLRSGEIRLPPAAESHISSEESALATVLAALLANR